MTALPVPASGVWTLADLQGLPDDGNRYEIVDGSLLVTPPPGAAHAVTTDLLGRVLLRAVPEEVEVLWSGVGVAVGSSTLVPDLVVVRAASLRGQTRLLPPIDVLLVVEVLSPSNRAQDLELKPARYAAAGIPSYWIVDPAVPSLTVLELATGRYRERAVVRGGDGFEAEQPFPVSVVPAALVRR